MNSQRPSEATTMNLSSTSSQMYQNWPCSRLLQAHWSLQQSKPRSLRMNESLQALEYSSLWSKFEKDPSVIHLHQGTETPVLHSFWSCKLLSRLRPYDRMIRAYDSISHLFDCRSLLWSLPSWHKKDEPHVDIEGKLLSQRSWYLFQIIKALLKFSERLRAVSFTRYFDLFFSRLCFLSKNTRYFLVGSP